MELATSGDLRDQAAAARFYDRRFQNGYMESWSNGKLDRVSDLIRELGLPAEGRALDFGCGTGVFTEVLCRALPGWTIEGTDLSPVATAAARQRLPQCCFSPLSEFSRDEGRFDLIFTHHVLEHVSDLPATARMLANISKPSASMFHILPCGNSGSFDHQVCSLRTDGIRTQPERLFFFEEEGHLRRLSTEDLVSLWDEAGYRLSHDWYALHRVGALDRRTAFGSADVLEFTASDNAIDLPSRRMLRRLQVKMLALWALRKPGMLVRNKTKHGCHSARDYVLLLGGLAAYPISWLTELTLKHLESREWASRCRDRAGSEMFIHLVRP